MLPNRNRSGNGSFVQSPSTPSNYLWGQSLLKVAFEFNNTKAVTKYERPYRRHSCDVIKERS